MKRTIATTPLPLHSICVFGDIFLRCDILPTSTLVELTLALITGGDPIDKIFIHCSRLQSLTILVGDKYVGDVGVALRTHSNTLPLLTAFQLYYPSMGQMMAEALIAFLRNKVFLERLDLGHHWSSCCFDDIEPVLDILPALPRLRVLGAELSSSNRTWQTLTSAHLQYLAQRIPARLSALSIWVGCRSRATLTKEDWKQLIRSPLLSPVSMFLRGHRPLFCFRLLGTVRRAELSPLHIHSDGPRLPWHPRTAGCSRRPPAAASHPCRLK